MTEATFPRTTDSGSADAGEKNRDRAQTVQDFAVGIGIFLLAVAFVFSFVPSIITPFADAGGANTAQADRIAATIVENASTGNDANEIDGAVFQSGGHYDGTSEELADELGLQKSNGHAIDHVNVTVVHIDDVTKSDPTPEYESGDPYDGQVGASSTRIVTTPGSSCEPACQLVVRVW